MHIERYNKQLGEHIKKVRENLALSQKDVAALMDINEQNVSAYERGKRNPGTFWINRFCESLEIDPADFYCEFYKKKYTP